MIILRTLMTIMIKIVLACLAIFAGIFAVKFLLFPAVYFIFNMQSGQLKVVEQFTTLMFIGLGYYLYVKYYEKRRPDELTFRASHLFYGAVSGAALISVTSLLLFYLGYYEVVSFQGLEGIPIVGSTILVAAMLEEFLFRGVLFRVIEAHVGTLFSLSFVATLFGLLHLFNENTTVVTAFSVTLLGVFWGGIYVLTRNIWVVGLNHAAWNFSIFSTGIPLSGNEDWRAVAPFESIYNGPLLLTGGEFGPEDSIINIIVLLISVVVIFYFAQKNRAIVGFGENTTSPKSEKEV
ncbi:CPBP family intramembrane metalloprotease [Psychrosphaera sp. B3R10]|uniref:CPBP family intramembrane glutamic endopeptidase n=1 Tax=unclassified Psychrosphaera TaxID=2641570 RepID=UPI001C0A61A0|nr:MULTISPECIES: type II CAAX endopeptidase family protein [unclassified Psychrosphaera]MBU2880477.1 CPBP family intramembrane metalloprotease [Psychrosphaera sp. I2R16]MBU2991422.1 CPBP family intramembrane metalloprotease [Psychrosphaera sp. B3R10]